MHHLRTNDPRGTEQCHLAIWLKDVRFNRSLWQIIGHIKFNEAPLFFLNILISFFFTVPPLLLEGYTGDRLLNAPEYLKYLVPVYKIKWKTGTRLVISDLGGTNNSFWGKFDQKSLFPLSQSNVQSPFLKREFRFMCQTGQYHLITTSRWSRPCPEPSAGAAVMKVYLLIMDRLAVTLSSSYWLVVIVQEWIYLIDLLWFLCFISS